MSHDAEPFMGPTGCECPAFHSGRMSHNAELFMGPGTPVPARTL